MQKGYALGLPIVTERKGKGCKIREAIVKEDVSSAFTMAYHLIETHIFWQRGIIKPLFMKMEPFHDFFLGCRFQGEENLFCEF